MVRFQFVGMRDGSDWTTVTVIGGGLAGMAASIHLARAAYRVLCIESEPGSHPPVGESLDWSAPALLADLGLPMDRLIEENIATYKRHVTVKLMDGSSRHYEPGEWLEKPPYNVELRTLHVDRLQLDQALREVTLNEGVEMVKDRIVDIESDQRRITAVKTASGRRISSAWFIDASGSKASLFPRAFQLPAYEYGPRKVGMWAYFNVAASEEGTTLYMDGQPPYMEWIWEIPIHPNVLSVGYVAAGDAIKDKRRQGLTVEEIFRERIARIPRLSALAPTTRALAPHVTSFQCRVYRKLAGPNWLIVGESASMVDPMTANGVTAALRHAAEAAELIVRHGRRKRLPRVAGALYSTRIVDLGRFFNCGIEKVIYDPAIRKRVGVLAAGRVYTVPAWVLNSIYSRIRPSGVVSTLLFGLVLNLFRTAGNVFSALCRVAR
jgi:flavin-dependent dehydrogenase